jgi:hypothetical protein
MLQCLTQGHHCVHINIMVLVIPASKWEVNEVLYNFYFSLSTVRMIKLCGIRLEKRNAYRLL